MGQKSQYWLAWPLLLLLGTWLGYEWMRADNPYDHFGLSEVRDIITVPKGVLPEREAPPRLLSDKEKQNFLDRMLEAEWKRYRWFENRVRPTNGYVLFVFQNNAFQASFRKDRLELGDYYLPLDENQTLQLLNQLHLRSTASRSVSRWMPSTKATEKAEELQLLNANLQKLETLRPASVSEEGWQRLYQALRNCTTELSIWSHSYEAEDLRKIRLDIEELITQPPVTPETCKQIWNRIRDVSIEIEEHMDSVRAETFSPAYHEVVNELAPRLKLD